MLAKKASLRQRKKITLKKKLIARCVEGWGPGRFKGVFSGDFRETIIGWSESEKGNILWEKRKER